jgi:hypothetical protein
MRSLLAIILLTVISLIGRAQEYPRKKIDQARLADELFGFQDLDISYEELYENTLQLLSNPININKAGAEELRFLNILSETQIQNLIKHRNENGPLVSIYELQSIAGFDAVTISRFAPFVYAPDPSVELNHSIFQRALDEHNNYLITRYERTVETKAGYTNDAPSNKQFKGSPDKFYLRFRTSRPGDFSFGLTAEKDAGEQMLWAPSSKQYLFDFISYHAQVQNKGRLKNLIIGDYQSQFGQGLMFGGSFGMGKGGETITTTRRCNIGFSPYTSANEFALQRGIATTYQLSRNVFVSAFASHVSRDASTTNSEGNLGISSFQFTGLHRNETELENRKTVRENNRGVILHYSNRNIDAGIMYNYLHLDKPVNVRSAIYNQFSFDGDVNQNAGIYLNYNYNNFLLFSELAKSLNGGWGGIAGLIGSLTPKLDLSILYRKYDRNFYYTYSNAFSESSMPQNESGIYWGWRYRFNRQFSFVGYTDLFRFPWLRFRSYKPSSGSEWLARLTYQPSKQVTIFAQAREERKLRNTSDITTTYQTSEGTKRNYLINFNYSISQQLSMKTRLQGSSYHINQKTTKGLAVIQDISYNIGRIDITARYALFDTDDFDNRQYVYEQDVWLAYSLPAYYGTGIRNFILIEYNPSKKITLWLRYARTRYSNTDTIGSGQDQIQGNTKNDIKLQLRLKL